MRRDWLTFAFGIALVGVVVALSVRQNRLHPAAPAPVATESATASSTPADPAADPPAASPSSAPGTPAPSSARAKPRTPAAPAAPAAENAATPSTAVVLQVHSDVPGASVFLDREFVGTTPLTVRDLAAGSKQVNVTATGHEGYAETIDLKEGSNRVSVEFLKVRLNATIPVVHRHAMGSCQGMLTASPKGIVYETSNKSDAFSLTFPDLEEFDVDYMKKNLRVRRRAGKTWNFTNDNADALFVFHRDVDKARERLATAR